MTMFEMKQQEAKNNANEALKRYGMELDMRMSSWRYTDSTCKCGVLITYSKRYPLKGNKALIEQLRADGYHVSVAKMRDYESDTRESRMMFWVTVEARYDC